MTSLTPHVFEGTSLRTYLCADGEVEFVATDVATILGYRMASDMTRSLEADEKGTRSVSTPGGPFLNHRTGELELPAPTIRITAKGLSALHRILGGTADLDSLLDSEVAA